MKPDTAFIGGIGLEKHFSEMSIDTKIHASYRSHSKQVNKTFTAKEIKVNSHQILFINRYSIGLSEGKPKYAPHEIDYKSMIVGLYQSGIKKIISVNMCGSLQKDLTPGSITVFKDFVDMVNRDITLDDIGFEVADMTIPFDPGISEAVKKAAESEGIRIGPDTTYIVCVDGSRLETPAEITLIQSVFKTGLVFGMEVPTEAQLAKLLGLKYAAIGLVTNYATGLRKGKITQAIIEGSFEKRAPKVAKLLFRALDSMK